MSRGEASDGLRVILEDSEENLLWDRVDEKGVSQVAEKTGYNPEDVYNWRSKDLFIPLDFVSFFLKNPEVSELKGQGNSKPVLLNDFPLMIDDELLTRISESVYVNGEGVPTYRTREFSLLRRFEELLSSLGEVPYTVYHRDGYYDLRYPKFLHDIFQKKSFEKDLAAAIDESGNIKGEKILLGERDIHIQDFEGELYSLRKREKIARIKKDSEELEKIIGRQVSKAKELF